MSSKAEPTLKRKENKKKLIEEGSIEMKSNGRRINENFGKRKRSLIRKSDEIGRLYEADIYIAVRRKGRCAIYTNCFSPFWPPRREDIVGCPSLFYCLTNLAKETYYPVPVIMTPEDFRQEIRKSKDKDRSSFYDSRK